MTIILVTFPVTLQLHESKIKRPSTIENALLLGPSASIPGSFNVITEKVYY